MVVYEDFAAFEKHALALFHQRPAETRVVMKHKEKAQLIIVRVTDNHTVLKFKTDQQADVKKITDLTAQFIIQMPKKREREHRDSTASDHDGAGPSAPARKKGNKR